MTYTVTDWVDGVTPVNAANLDKLEAGVASAHVTADAAQAAIASGVVPLDGTVIAATRILANKISGAHAQPTFRILGNGELDWGPGASTATDVSLYRHASGYLTTPNHFNVDQNVWANGWGGATNKITIGDLGSSKHGVQFGTDTNLYRSAANTLKTDDYFVSALAIYSLRGDGGSGFLYNPATAVGRALDSAVGAEANSRFTIGVDGGVSWGPGGATALDTTLFRASAAVLSTGGYFTAASDVYAQRTFAQETIMGAIGPASQGGLRIAGDTNLYRAGANALRTDDSFSAYNDSGIFTNGSTVNQYGFRTYVGAEATPRILIQANGDIYWGPGSGGGDTVLYRASAGVLQTGGVFTASGPISIGGGSNLRFQRQDGSTISLLTDGSAYGQLRLNLIQFDVDTNLYRQGADVLRTDDTFVAVGNIAAATGTTYEAQIGWGTGGVGTLLLGGDARLYRNYAASLQTSGDLWVGTSVIVMGNVLYFGAAQDTAFARDSAGQIRTDGKFRAVGGYIDPQVGTSLPGSPVDGQIYTLIDSFTAPTYAWKFQYLASISDAYKWVCIGGAPVITEVQTSSTTGSTTYAALAATTGPSFTLPRAGIYVVRVECHMSTGSNGNSAWMSYDIGATGAVDADAARRSMDGTAFNQSSAGAQRTKTFTAADALVCKYRVTGNTGTFLNRTLSVMPVRCS